MRILTIAALVAGLLAQSGAVMAQINDISLGKSPYRSTDSLVGGMTAYASGTFRAGSSNDWSSPSSPASLSANGTMTFGPNDGKSLLGGYDGWSTTANNLCNASGRSIIRGKNNNGGTYASYFYAVVTSNNAVSVVIWGPTLNNYGITGATNFTWTAYTASGYSNSGSGEASFTVPQSYMKIGSTTYGLQVTVQPSSDNELGSAMVNFYN